MAQDNFNYPNIKAVKTRHIIQSDGSVIVEHTVCTDLKLHKLAKDHDAACVDGLLKFLARFIHGDSNQKIILEEM
jgi:hypothetical protein